MTTGDAGFDNIMWNGKPLDFKHDPCTSVTLIECKLRSAGNKIGIDMRYKVNKEFMKMENPCYEKK